MKRLIIVLMWGLFAIGATAHDDHEMPGALPPPPHGGRAEPVEDAHPHRHAAGVSEKDAKPAHEETEIFVEAVYQNKKLRLYPIALAANNSRFVPLHPREFQNLAVKIEFPRARKTENIPVKATADGWEADYDVKKAHRFLVHVAFQHRDEMKKTTIQIETI